MDWALFLSTFGLIFLAELPDKTVFITLLLAARGRPFATFLGAAAAFTLHCALAVAGGSLLASLPVQWVHLASALLFLLFAVLEWRGANEAEEEDEGAIATATGGWAMAWKAFVMIFLAEWGDLTQIAMATIAAREARPVLIFAASLSALLAATALAIALGRAASRYLKPRLLKRIAAVVFLAAGVAFLVSDTFW